MKTSQACFHWKKLRYFLINWFFINQTNFMEKQLRFHWVFIFFFKMHICDKKKVSSLPIIAHKFLLFPAQSPLFSFWNWFSFSYLCSLKKNDNNMVDIKPDEISAILKSQLSNLDVEANLEEVSREIYRFKDAESHAVSSSFICSPYSLCCCVGDGDLFNLKTSQVYGPFAEMYLMGKYRRQRTLKFKDCFHR